MNHNAEILAGVIMEDAFQEAAAILEKAEKEAVSIREESLKKQRELRQQSEDTRNQIDLFLARAKMISQAELKARMELICRKEAVLENTLQAVKHTFFSLPTCPDYPSLLKRLVLNAVTHLEGDCFICRVNKRDQCLLNPHLMGELSRQTGKKISLDNECTEIQGGVMVWRSDGRLLFDNSLEGIFHRQIERMRSLAAGYFSLFEEERGEKECPGKWE
jgi:vacuolar-type H+-ATPase subunit E/Vma4